MHEVYSQEYNCPRINLDYSLLAQAQHRFSRLLSSPLPFSDLCPVGLHIHVCHLAEEGRALNLT